MEKIKISGKWRLYYFEQYERNEVSPADLYGRESIPCTVPGNVELELINQGILPEDIYMGQNIRLTEAYEKYKWWYETKITMPDIKGRAYLYFEGVDTLAEYWLDGEKIGKSENMLIPVKIPVKNPVAGKTYTLCVRLRSPIIEAEKIPFDMLRHQRIEPRMPCILKISCLFGLSSSKGVSLSSSSVPKIQMIFKTEGRRV